MGVGPVRLADMRRYIDAQRKTVYVKVWQDRALLATNIFGRGATP